MQSATSIVKHHKYIYYYNQIWNTYDFLGYSNKNHIMSYKPN